jgi:hypothetical protein
LQTPSSQVSRLRKWCFTRLHVVLVNLYEGKMETRPLWKRDPIVPSPAVTNTIDRKVYAKTWKLERDVPVSPPRNIST